MRHGRQGFDDAVIGFNLVPPNLRNRSRTAVNWLRVGTICAVALTVFAVSGSVLNYMSTGIYEQQVLEQRAQVLRVDVLERQIRDERRENQALVREMDGLPSVAGQGQTPALLSFLAALSAAVTDGILLDFIEYSRGGDWLIGGVGVDPAEISSFFERIGQLSGVEQAALAQLRHVAGEESSLRRFEVRIQWRAGGTQR